MYIDGLQEAVLAGTSWEGIMLWMQSNVVHSVRINYKFSIELTSSSYLPLPLGTELETVPAEISAAITKYNMFVTILIKTECRKNQQGSFLLFDVGEIVVGIEDALAIE